MNNILGALEDFQRGVFRVHGGGDAHGPGIAAWVDHLLTQISESGISGLGSFLFPGLAGLGSGHPILVHFPIALLSCFLILELFANILKNQNLRGTACWMLYLGTLGAMATVFTGFLEASSVAHGAEVHALIEKHKAAGLTVVGIALFLSVWRLICRARFSAVGAGFHLLLGVVMVAVMVTGADLGALMVYKHGVRVQAVQQPEDHDHNHDHGHLMAKEPVKAQERVEERAEEPVQVGVQDRVQEPVHAKKREPVKVKVPMKVHEHEHGADHDHHH
ncbi:MAG: DUF2231 domain-containing protein [Pseudomonadota bacterium]